jgi:hypothetical protein
MNTMNEPANEMGGISWHDWLERNRREELRGVALRARLTKYAAMAALLLSVVFWGSAADYQAVLGFAVCAGAVRVTFLAAAARKYDWASLFIGMALLYNPVFPVFALTGPGAFFLVIASITPFAASLFLLKPRLTPSVVW